MAAKRLSLLTLTATLTGAFGLWLAAGAITASSGDRLAPRIGVLPSPWWLVLAVLVAVAVAAAVRHLSRLNPLWLASLAALPWFPTAVPAALLVWTGAICGWLWAAIAAALVAPWLRENTPASWRRVAGHPRRAPAIAAVLAAAAYLSAAYLVSPQVPAGDEPHYLVVTQSLLLDHDLKIENNHRRGDYRAYYGGELRPDYLQRGIDAQIYSIHAPGLSVAVAPAFALFGYPGVAVFLALLSAAATAVMWKAVWEATGDAAASWFGWAAVALSAPFALQSFIAYPDALGAAIVMVGVSAMLGGRGVSDRRLFATGAALAALPWLHTRFSLAAAVLAFLILARNGRGDRQVRRAAALLVVPIVSAFGWFGFFYAIYGTADPRAPYGGYTQSAVDNLGRGIPGLLFDQQFGLLPNAPVFLCALAGFWVLVRRKPRLALELAALILPYGLAVGAFYMWWGGFSSPARFLTLIVMPLAIPAGVWFHCAGRGGRILGLAGLFLSVAITGTLVSVDRGALLYNSRDGASRLLLWLAPSVNLTTGFPSLFQTTAPRALLNAGVWAVGLVLVVSLTLVAARRLGSVPGTCLAPTTVAVAAGLAAAFAAMTALTIVWRLNGAAPLTPGRGTLALLSTYNRESGRLAFSLSPFARLPSAAVPSRLTVADIRPSSVAADEPLIVLRGVAAATYEIEATMARAAKGHISVTIDRTFGPLWSWDLTGAEGSIRHTITLPVPIGAAIVDVEPEARSAMERLVIRPLRGVPTQERLGATAPDHAARYGPAIVFLMGGRAFMEPPGAWVEGGSAATFVVMPEQPVPLRLFVRTPPIPNHVFLEGDGWSQELILAPGEERLVNIPTDPHRIAVRLRVSASAGARPTEFERGSTDSRFLGCWIEVR